MLDGLFGEQVEWDIDIAFRGCRWLGSFFGLLNGFKPTILQNVTQDTTFNT
jgi:hypothetical protein